MITHFLALGITAKQAGGSDLVAVGIATGAAFVGLPALSVSGLTPIRQGGRSRQRIEVNRPAEKIVADLLALPTIATAANVGAAAIGQIHDMTPDGATSQAAAFTAPGMTRSFARNDSAFWALAA